VKNRGGQFEPELGGHFQPKSGGHFKSELGGQFDRNLQQGAKFNKIMKSIKDNPDFHRKRYLDIVKKSGVGQDFYSNKIFEELGKNYTLKK
jgi:hypothetical protein